jgi:hypothetical protein
MEQPRIEPDSAYWKVCRSHFFPEVGGGGASTQAWMPTFDVSILRIP